MCFLRSSLRKEVEYCLSVKFYCKFNALPRFLIGKGATRNLVQYKLDSRTRPIVVPGTTVALPCTSLLSHPCRSSGQSSDSHRGGAVGRGRGQQQLNPYLTNARVGSTYLSLQIPSPIPFYPTHKISLHNLLPNQFGLRLFPSTSSSSSPRPNLKSQDELKYCSSS